MKNFCAGIGLFVIFLFAAWCFQDEKSIKMTESIASPPLASFVAPVEHCVISGSEARERKAELLSAMQ